MSDRLSQLLRQRALLQEHLAWLDREIAAATEKTATTPASLALSDAVPPPPAPPAPPVPPSPIAIPTGLPAPSPIVATTVREVVGGAGVAPEADAILDKYRVSSSNLQQDVRKGCFLYLAAAFVITGLIVTILFFALHKR